MRLLNNDSPINILKDRVYINGTSYLLDDLRDYLTAEWNVLTHKFFIRWIVTKNGLTAQYDWQAIFTEVTNCYYTLYCFTQTAQPVCFKSQSTK